MGFIRWLLVWLPLWVVGTVVAEALDLSGPWMMFAGAITFIVCEAVTEWVFR